MIKAHKLNGQEIAINAEFIEQIESVPDTKITLTTRNQYIVKEKADEIIQKVISYHAQIELELEKIKNENKA